MSSSIRKKERRLARHLRNIKKEQDHKKEAWEAGKLIKPNHNGGPYPSDYCIELGKRLVERIKNFKESIIQNPQEDLQDGVDWNNLTAEEQHTILNDRFVKKFRLYKLKSIEFILHFSPDIQKTADYDYIKFALETYWDNQDKMIDLL